MKYTKQVDNYPAKDKEEILEGEIHMYTEFNVFCVSTITSITVVYGISGFVLNFFCCHLKLI